MEKFWSDDEGVDDEYRWSIREVPGEESRMESDVVEVAAMGGAMVVEDVWAKTGAQHQEASGDGDRFEVVEETRMGVSSWNEQNEAQWRWSKRGKSEKKGATPW